MTDGKYALNKNPNSTYVSQVVGKDKNIRYISKVFDLKDFKNYYFDNKEKKVFEVIKESTRQEVTTILTQSDNSTSN